MDAITLSVLRNSLGMNQKDFAAYFGLSVRNLQDWEQGRKNPPLYLIEMIKRILILEKTLKDAGLKIPEQALPSKEPKPYMTRVKKKRMKEENEQKEQSDAECDGDGGKEL